MGPTIWLSMGPPPIKMYEHATVLIEYLANVHTILQTSAKPSVSAMQGVVQEAMQFAERTKKEPSLTDIINKLELLESTAQKHRLQNEGIEDQLVILKNAPTAGGSTQKPSSWASLLHNASPPPNLTHKAPAYNKNYEVIVKINDPDSARVLQAQTPEEITQSIDDQLKRQNITQTRIHTAQVLKSGDIAVQVVNDKEIQKLQHNHGWTTILGGKAFISTKTYGIIVHGVPIARIDLKSPDTSRWLTMQNADTFPDMNIRWLGWLTPPKVGKTEASLVLELDDAETVNKIIDEGMVIGFGMHRCVL